MEKPSRFQRARRAALALALSSLVCALVAELAVRWKYGSPLQERQPLLQIRANRLRGWEMVPGHLHYTYHHPVRVNSLGLRGPEVLPKQPGELRVLCLGDSLTYGQGVADEHTLPHLLERALGERTGGAVSVVNGGLRAYATNQELGLLEELGPRIAPEAVVLLWFNNDLIERDLERTARDLEASGPIVFDVGARMEGRVELRWRLKQLVRRSALAMELHDRYQLAESSEWSPDFIEHGFARLDGYLARYAQLARERGFRALFAIVPDINSLRAPNRTQQLDARALELARAHGLDCIELRAALQPLVRPGQRLPVVPFDGHYDAAGNAAMAAALAEELAAP
jgi:lysophospholipase L1-like esterase